LREVWRLGENEAHETFLPFSGCGITYSGFDSDNCAGDKDIVPWDELRDVGGVEHDRVVLTKAVAGEGLEAGDVGTVVHLYGDGKALTKWNLSRWMVTPLLLPRSKHRMFDR